MILFWAAAGVLSAAAAALILARAAAAAPPADATVPVYRRQLAEIDELAARGLMGEAERKAAHAEAARRLLAAAEAPAQPWTADPRQRRAVMATAALAPLLAVALYAVVGVPGLADQPFAGRLAAWKAADPGALAPPEMAAVLRAITAQRPNDPEGYRFLALAEGASDNPAGAVQALRRAVRVAPARADLWEMLGEAVALRDGEVGSEARAAFARALALDPRSVAARYHLARAKVEGGDTAEGLAEWRALAAELPATDPRKRAVLSAVERAGAPAATLADDQRAAIRGMVEGLANRLAANPDDPQGWVRLVRSYAVLGETDRRDAALAEARRRFAADPKVVADLNAAAAAEPMR